MTNTNNVTSIFRASGKVWEKLEKKCDHCQKVGKSATLAQKCEITDFGQIVHNNAIMLKQCNLVRFLPKSAGSHPHTFPDALYYWWSWRDVRS